MKNVNSQTSGNNPLLSIGVCLACALLNFGIGAIVKALNLPLYFDSVGTILAVLLLGWRWGAVAGILGFIVTAITINPFAIYFVGTQVALAVVAHLFARWGGFKNILRVLLSGIVFGIVAAIVSAPVIIWVFGGATGNGASLVTSMFVQMGNQIINSVFLSGFSIEPIDKALQCIVAFFLVKSIPHKFLVAFTKGSLRHNKLV